MRIRLLLLATVLVASAAAQPVLEKAAPPPAGPLAELSLADAAVLGAVEGITEYLPVSSTGHLIIAARALRVDSNLPLRRANGEVHWFVPPTAKHPDGVPLTLKLAADTYVVVIQFGAIAAVGMLYWRQLVAMLLGLLGRDPAGLRLLRNVLLAFLPAAIVGFLVHDWIDTHLFSLEAVIAAQVAGAGLILWAERYRRRRVATTARHPEFPTDLSMGAAFRIGLLQCVSLWPGTSRSMMTIIGGYLAGLDPRRSAEFSFLLGFVTLSAATVYKSLKTGEAMIMIFGWPHVLFGCVVAAITAALAVKFLVGWLSRHGMAIFAYYRLALAAGLGILAAVGWL
ncbi:undecaprenyl-diphosphate phosphatase [Opitutus terrae]|uniref:Undecaprenyl-diphosphatase n=1 Tax=Opitutus terrae (strain DSM 11246 / JCM 15787 / PB90-1) TaxID=452637 RepID=B1ZWC3_OPITP|nr:undecaprenyl-diphosphate phosphatase [Opitutus terrae]ACB76875.1 Bacitracin resistance protein BacA [Opitutus terrae PB90-1]